MGDRDRGIHDKFIVRRTDESDLPGGRHHGCRYFVLDVTHDKYAVPALLAYAAACGADGYAALADDLRAIASGAPWPEQEPGDERDD